MQKKEDWRDAYVCCEHVLELPHNPLVKDVYKDGIRVCCKDCYPKFLYPDLEEVKQ